MVTAVEMTAQPPCSGVFIHLAPGLQPSRAESLPTKKPCPILVLKTQMCLPTAHPPVKLQNAVFAELHSPANAMQTLSSRAQIFRTVRSSCSLATDFFSTPRTTMSFPRTPTCDKNQHEVMPPGRAPRAAVHRSCERPGAAALHTPSCCGDPPCPPWVLIHVR